MTDVQHVGAETLVPITTDDTVGFQEVTAETTAEAAGPAEETEEGAVTDGVPEDGDPDDGQQVIYRVEIKAQMTRAEMGKAMREWVEETRWWLDDLVADGVPAAVLASDMPEAVYANVRVALSAGMEDYQSVVDLAPVRERAVSASEGMSMPALRGIRTAAASYERGLFENLVSIAALILTLDAMSNNTVPAGGDSEQLWPFSGALA